MAERMTRNRVATVERVVAEAERLCAEGGSAAMGVRSVASAAGCTPGNVHAALGGISGLVLAVNARTLARLRDRLAALPRRKGVPGVMALANAYLDFVGENPRLWRMVLDEEGTASGTERPAEVGHVLAELVGMVEAALGDTVPDLAARRGCVATLWASLQGIASLHASGKLSVVGGGFDPHDMAWTLVTAFMKGVTTKATSEAMVARALEALDRVPGDPPARGDVGGAASTAGLR